jgi:hypothetical protein
MISSYLSLALAFMPFLFGAYSVVLNNDLSITCFGSFSMVRVLVLAIFSTLI